jgi:chromate reductase
VSGRFRVLAVSGSLRAGSANTGLLRMAQRLAPAELDVAHDDTISELPYYNADLDVPDELPEVVREWRERVTACDALFMAAPEYNFGPSAVLKNAIDWASRPMGAASLTGKVITIVTSGGKGGGARVQAGLTDILTLLGNTLVQEPQITVALGYQRIEVDGTTTDPALEQLVAARMANVLAALNDRAG